MATQVKTIRIKKGMSQGELAEKSGVSRQTLCAIEKHPEYNPRISTMEAIAKALDVPVKRLFLP